MYLLGFSLDNISLMAVTIAIGFVIDDAIIMIENIIRLIRAGETPINAAVKGTRQMGFTIISITVALTAALIPVLFMPDIVGRLFREFGIDSGGGYNRLRAGVPDAHADAVPLAAKR